jgi:hypothetical protein
MSGRRLPLKAGECVLAQPGDNLLPDLAARIRAEHAAVGEAMKHAIEPWASGKATP